MSKLAYHSECLTAEHCLPWDELTNMPREMLRLRQLRRLLAGMWIIDRNRRSNSGTAARCFGHSAAMTDVLKDRVEGFLWL